MVAQDSSLTSGRSKTRKIYRNIAITDLVRYRLPLSGIVSILHRISGLILFLLLPLLTYLLNLSLTSESTYYYLQGVLAHPLLKVGSVVLMWAFFHHLCAGVRHLFMDTHRYTSKVAARRTSLVVFVISVSLTAVAVAVFW